MSIVSHEMKESTLRVLDLGLTQPMTKLIQVRKRVYIHAYEFII